MLAILPLFLAAPHLAAPIPVGEQAAADTPFTVVEYSRETTPQVSAYEDCDPDRPSMRENQHRYLWLREHSRLDIACLDVGRALAVVPAAIAESGELHPPQLVFAAAGSLWFLSPGMDEPGQYALPTPHGDLSEIGWSIELADDVDGDGVQDLIVRVYSRSASRWLHHVFSTGRRRLLHRVPGLDGAVGHCRVPDLDGDGVDELAVMTKSEVEAEAGSRFALRLTLHSVATGKSLSVLAETASGSRSGLIECAPIGPGASAAVVVAGTRLRAFELTTGEVLWSHDFTPDLDHYAHGLLICDDLSGDGIRDIAVGVSHGPIEVEVQWRCGRTGDPLRVTRGFHTDSESGYCLAPYIDVDGDGSEETLTTHLPFSSSVVMLSSRDGSALLEVDDPLNWSNGSFLDASIDWDGKGLPDLVIGEDVRTCGGMAQEICIVSMEDHCVLRSFTPASMTHFLARD